MKQNLVKQNSEFESDDKRVKWEFIKYKIRQLSISYSKEKKRNLRSSQTMLEHELIELERNLSNNSDLTRCNEIKQELQEMENNVVEGIIIRNKIDWVEKGEKCSKYFFMLEQSRVVKKHM